MIADDQTDWRAELRRHHPWLGSVGISVNDGWWGLLERLCADIEAVSTAEERDKLHVTTIKEKLGGLRVYIDDAPPAVFEVKSAACAASLTICELCGRAGRLTTQAGYLQTLCEQHAAEAGAVPIDPKSGAPIS